MLQSVSEGREVLGLGFMIVTPVLATIERYLLSHAADYSICQDPGDSAKAHTNFRLEFHNFRKSQTWVFGHGVGRNYSGTGNHFCPLSQMFQVKQQRKGCWGGPYPTLGHR